MLKHSRNIPFIILSAAFLLTAGVSGAEIAPFQGEITADNIHVRVDSTASAETIFLLNKGERIEVISETYGWYKVKLPKNAPAYIKKVFIVPLKDNTGEVEKTNVNVRMRPETKAPIIGKVNKGDLLTILNDAENGWYKIEPPENSFGWVHTKFVKTAPAEQEAPSESKPEGASLEKETTEAKEIKEIKEVKKIKEPKETREIEKAEAKVEIEKNPAATIELNKELKWPKVWEEIELMLPEKTESEEEAAEKSAVEITNALSSVEGIVTPYGKVFRRITTHKLTTKDKKIYLLKGDKTLLNSLNYRKVKIEGNLIEYKKQKYPVIEVTKSEILK